MGGGDLNLKKSWHPNTMKNMERVWKAEQRDNEEKRRIAELQREITAERDKEEMQKFAQDTGVVKKKDDVKLEWMYKGPSQSVNREEYLLGKAVDKNFERHNNEQIGDFQEEERLPGALREAKSSMIGEQVDIARKLHEDPLMAIRQRAIEKAKEIYKNPVKMKQFQKMVSKKKEEGEHKKDKKKKKKIKKDEERLLDALLKEKLKSALKDREMFRKIKKKAKRDSSDSSSSSSSSSSSESDEDDTNRRHGKESTNSHIKERDTFKVQQKRSISPPNSMDDRKNKRHYYSKDEERGKYNENSRHERRGKYSDSSYDNMGSRRRSRSPRPSNSRSSHDYVNRNKSRSRSRERHFDRKEQRMKHYDRQKTKGTRSISPEPSTSKGRKFSPKKSLLKHKTPSSSEDELRNDKEKSNKTNHAASDSPSDSDDDHKQKKKRSFGLMMADGSKPVKKEQPVVKDVKAPSQQKPVPWQRKEKIKLTEEEKERRRQEMIKNANWRDKEREENVKRYRMEEDHERQELQENFDGEFARKQFSKATEQASIEGRIKSKLNTIQRSKAAMDQNFARR